MSKYLWLGAVADKTYLKEMTKNGNKQSTAYNVQDKLIRGLEFNDIVIDTISGHVVPPFPKYKKMFVRKRKWVRDTNSINIDIGFLNLPIINLLIKGFFLKKAALRWSKVNKDEKKIIFVYSLHSPFLKAACAIKRQYNNTDIVVIIPDLPEYMNAHVNKVKALLKKIDRVLINKYVTESDAFVLFAEPMKKHLPLLNHSFCVMEGILEVEYDRYLKCISEINHDSDKQIIMISGALSKEDGIEILINSFSLIEDDKYELWITGTGIADDNMADYSRNDSRIKFFGYLASYDELLSLQRQANIFVAMVPPENPKSRYFFPSKIMEYLITGASVITFKLDCIPNEYNDHLFFFDNTDYKTVADKIIEVSMLPSEVKNKMAIERYNLLIMKTKEAQGAKILDLVKGLLKI